MGKKRKGNAAALNNPIRQACPGPRLGPGGSHIVKTLRALQANRYVVIPGTTRVETLGDSWKSRAETARDRAAKATGLENTDADEAGREWQKIFGTDIPIR